MADELETTDFAADFLKVHPETVRRLIRSGELPAVKVGRNWRVRRSDLERIAERGTGEPGLVSLKKRGVTMDKYTGIVHCLTCGKGWAVMLGQDGRLPRGFWRCPNGCNAEGAPVGEPGQDKAQS